MSGVCRVLAAACLGLALTFAASSSVGVPLGDLAAFIPPVLATSCGQGSGTAQVRESCERLGVTCWDKPQLRMGDLGAACCAEAACPFGGVLFVVIEINDQALRELGVDIAYEIERCSAIASRATELGMAVVVSLMGETSRDATVTEIEMLAALAATTDLIITRSGADARETFGLLALQAEVPWVELGGPQDLDLLLAQLFTPAAAVAVQQLAVINGAHAASVADDLDQDAHATPGLKWRAT